MQLTNLSLTFQWYYYNTLIQARTIDKAFRARAHYKHAAITNVFFAALHEMLTPLSAFTKDLSMKKTEQRTGHGAKQVRQSE